jgi:hypothetical protein
MLCFIQERQEARMKHLSFRVYRRLGPFAELAGLLCLSASAMAADLTAPFTAPNSTAEAPVSLFVAPAPAYVYRSPSLMTNTAQVPASGASEAVARTPTPNLEKPDNWACRTSNVLSRSSANRNPDGKSFSDIEHLLPKC